MPNGSADTATFGLSNTTNISISATTHGERIVFNAGASAFTVSTTNALPISPTLTFSGAGITNNSGIIQNFMTAGGGANNGGPAQIYFRNSAKAGSMTNYTSHAGTESTGLGGGIFFYNTSTADHGTFLNSGSTVAGAAGGFTIFNNTSTAGNGIFTNAGGIGVDDEGSGATEFVNASTAANGIFTNNGGTVSGADGGSTTFNDTSTAGSGTFTSNGGTVSGASGGSTIFNDTSTAVNATLIANGGTGGGAGGLILFYAGSTGGTASVKVFGNGNLDISEHNAPGVTVGSLEGSGNVFLGASKLTVGSNNVSTTFSGVIQDGGIIIADGGIGTGGSLTKIGTGTLTLSGVNTYTGATAVNAGAVIVNGALHAASAVSVESGATLGGAGAVNGAVTIKDGGILAPGAAGSPGTIRLGSLTLNPTSNLNFRLGAPGVVGGPSNDLIVVAWQPHARRNSERDQLRQLRASAVIG